MLTCSHMHLPHAQMHASTHGYTELEAKLEEMRLRHAAVNRTLYIVADTSSLLKVAATHCLFNGPPGYDGSSWGGQDLHDVRRAREIDESVLVVPRAVLQELDGLKRNS